MLDATADGHEQQAGSTLPSTLSPQSWAQCAEVSDGDEMPPLILNRGRSTGPASAPCPSTRASGTSAEPSASPSGLGNHVSRQILFASAHLIVQYETECDTDSAHASARTERDHAVVPTEATKQIEDTCVLTCLAAAVGPAADSFRQLGDYQKACDAGHAFIRGMTQVKRLSRDDSVDLHELFMLAMGKHTARRQQRDCRHYCLFELSLILHWNFLGLA